MISPCFVVLLFNLDHACGMHDVSTGWCWSTGTPTIPQRGGLLTVFMETAPLHPLRLSFTITSSGKQK